MSVNEPTEFTPVEADLPVETPDGKGIFVFRYDNPSVPNRNPDSPVSARSLEGKWFTHSPSGLKDYILMRPPGGNILVARVPKARAEELMAINHPTAKDLDIEPLDNYILPDDLLKTVESTPFDVPSSNPNKFLLADTERISQFVDNLTTQLSKGSQI